MKVASLIACAAAASIGAVHAAKATDSAAYKPEQAASGEIRIWANPPDGRLLKDWEEGFKKFHPGVTFSDKLAGPDSTMAGVYTRVADLALLSRELREPVERMAYEWVHRFKPFSIEVANDGIATDRPGANLAVFVHKDNPLTQLSVPQLDAVFGAEHLRGPANFRSWGDLGLTGDWQKRPIHVYGPEVDSIPGLFFKRAVLKNSSKWNPDLKELRYDETKPLADSDEKILEALAGDPEGIAYAAPRKNAAGVKMVAIAVKNGGPYFGLSEQSVASREYPLARSISMVAIRPPGKPLDPKVREFLRYVLSDEGQAAVQRDGAYIPLTASTRQEQLKRLD